MQFPKYSLFFFFLEKKPYNIIQEIAALVRIIKKRCGGTSSIHIENSLTCLAIL